MAERLQDCEALPGMLDKIGCSDD